MKREQHGWYGTPEYRAWIAMKTRCYNPNAKRYPDYGGKGITVCDAWRESFSAFLADMGPKPTPQHTVDRIKNELAYEPGNCRWATKQEQSINRERCWITHNGQRKRIGEWAKEFGITIKTIRERRQAGLPMEQVLAPATPRNERYQGRINQPIAKENAA